MEKPKESKAKKELEKIRSRHGGVLRPRDVVNFARNPKTALHARFEWNDTTAAEEYRLEQARRLIRCTVTWLPNQNKPITAYVSLLKDRRLGDSYRHIGDVMASPLDREQLVRQALDEAEAWAKRHRNYAELAEIVEAIEAASRSEAG